MQETKTDKIIICILVLVAIIAISYAVIKVWNNSVEYMRQNTFEISDDNTL